MSTFEKLAPFIQDYIYRNRWEELHEIQVAACDVIFNSDGNLLMATPTASGKTEAAFLPIITEIYNKPPNGVGVLYIAPLKALINDQFGRIAVLLEEAYIPVTKWHGDVGRTKKNRLLKNPKGVLQITPESLEAMLMKRKQDIVALFSDLRFVVIDEVHNFLGEDRGVQLSSILERIQALIDSVPRRIGLSATLGDLVAAEKWLNGGTERKCVTPSVSAERRKARIMASHFYTLPLKLDAEGTSWTDYYETLYSLTQGRKSIIFSNSRADVERNIVNLRELAGRKKERDTFLVHHGSVSASNREYAETQMKTSDLPLVTGATVTLELGIDLGDLERIVQTGCPHTVSSLAQRLGRSGRRSGISEMCFIFNEEKHDAGSEFYKHINWLFVKCIALIELYRENWLEPIFIEKYPFGVLFHQTMSFLFSRGEATAELLAQTMLTKNAFAFITQEDYRQLLRYMLEKKQIEKFGNTLLVGENGEHLTNHYEFYSVFETPVEYSVRDKSHEIGVLNDPMPPDTTFVLAGIAWVVTELDREQKIIYVEKVQGKPPTIWRGPGEGLEHTKVLQKMREVIATDGQYPYLHPNAAKRLEEIRRLIGQTGALHEGIFEISPDTCGVFPWLGTRAFNALDFALNKKLKHRQFVPHHWPMMLIKGVSRSELTAELRAIKAWELTIDDLALPSEVAPIGKYGEFVPSELLRKQFADRYIDIADMQEAFMLPTGR
ncbi:MAG: DEAD/DEAH box helicase [Oscillospiraceae bacterium]|jgi:ATP-dependent Lhr-like helicase|nr:DEAD/DEAH box helicase [Oscillospiraceae bacterium]